MTRTIISGWSMLVIRMYCESRPDVYAYKCRLPFLEAVRIREARPVYLIGKSGWVSPGWECVSRVIRRCVPRVIRGRGPYNAPLFNLPILPEQKMGGLKIIGFWIWVFLFAPIGPCGERGRRERGRHLWWAAVSVYSQIACRFNDSVAVRLVFRGVVPL